MQSYAWDAMRNEKMNIEIPIADNSLFSVVIFF